jgi:hypothetical protein
MHKFPEMKGYNIVMDSCSIYTGYNVAQLITNRGYKCVYLPAYSSELNPIEQFWAKVKSTIKGSKFTDVEDLRTRVSEACDGIRTQELKACAQHSVNVFDKTNADRTKTNYWGVQMVKPFLFHKKKTNILPLVSPVLIDIKGMS